MLVATVTPLSYIAGAVVGERDVYYQGRIVPVSEVYVEKGVQPLVMRPKEGLALTEWHSSHDSNCLPQL